MAMSELAVVAESMTGRVIYQPKAPLRSFVTYCAICYIRHTIWVRTRIMSKLQRELKRAASKAIPLSCLLHNIVNISRFLRDAVKAPFLAKLFQQVTDDQ